VRLLRVFSARCAPCSKEQTVEGSPATPSSYINTNATAWKEKIHVSTTTLPNQLLRRNHSVRRPYNTLLTPTNARTLFLGAPHYLPLWANPSIQKRRCCWAISIKNCSHLRLQYRRRTTMRKAR
ncbi:unnamed protein product, partial [Ectocarpus sp. 12 AP-2014]